MLTVTEEKQRLTIIGTSYNNIPCALGKQVGLQIRPFAGFDSSTRSHD